MIHLYINGVALQVGDWNTEPSEDDRKHIVSGCLDVLPSLVSTFHAHHVLDRFSA